MTEMQKNELKNLLDFNNQINKMANEAYLDKILKHLPKTAVADKALFNNLEMLCPDKVSFIKIEKLAAEALCQYEKQGFYYGFKTAVELLQNEIKE